MGLQGGVEKTLIRVEKFSIQKNIFYSSTQEVWLLRMLYPLFYPLPIVCYSQHYLASDLKYFSVACIMNCIVSKNLSYLMQCTYVVHLNSEQAHYAYIWEMWGSRVVWKKHWLLIKFSEQQWATKYLQLHETTIHHHLAAPTGSLYELTYGVCQWTHVSLLLFSDNQRKFTNSSFSYAFRTSVIYTVQSLLYNLYCIVSTL